MSARLLALRERARRWWGRTLVKAGVRCLHTVAPSVWRPGQMRWGGCRGPLVPTRFCEHCRTREVMTEGEYYAQFGRVFPRGAA